MCVNVFGHHILEDGLFLIDADITKYNQDFPIRSSREPFTEIKMTHVLLNIYVWLRAQCVVQTTNKSTLVKVEIWRRQG